MDWNKAIKYGRLVNASYDVFAGKAPVTPAYDLLATIYANDLATDMNPSRGKVRVSIALILQETASGEAVLAIRGTEGIKEWVQDARFGMKLFTHVGAAGNTEDGFTDMFLSMTVGQGDGALPVLKALPAIAWKRPVTSLTICGHSLGGALATLLAIDVAANAGAPFNNPTVYTYASPRAGDDIFAARYGQLVGTTFRVVDNVDVVPELPSDPPYRHVTPKIELDSLTLIPPRVRLQPNPLCWHIMSSYLYLMSLAAGGPPLKPASECAPSAFFGDLLLHLRKDLRSIDELADEFTASPRTFMGGN